MGASINSSRNGWLFVYSLPGLVSKCHQVMNNFIYTQKIHTTAHLHNLTEIVEAFIKANKGSPPKTIIIYRDGVGDGQLDMVLQYELTQIKEALKKSMETL